MLNHQFLFAQTLMEVYDPMLGSGPSDDGTIARHRQTPAESMRAVEDFTAAMENARDVLIPELVRYSPLL